MSEHGHFEMADFSYFIALSFRIEVLESQLRCLTPTWPFVQFNDYIIKLYLLTTTRSSSLVSGCITSPDNA